MPIVGTFEADFTQFSSAVQGASNDLRRLEGQTASMAKAFADMDADRPMIRLNEVTGVATTTLGGMATSLGSVDRTLSQFGLNLTPVVAALREMSVVAGMSVTQLGLLGTAAGVTAAALAGWNIGKWIADLTGADQKIGDVTASLFGLGNAADEVAAHKMDVLARATQLAGVEVTSFTEAVRILGEESKRLSASLNTPEAVMERLRVNVSAAQRDFRGLSESQRDNITRMLEWGTSAKEIEEIFKLHAGTVQVLIDRNKLLGEQEKVNTEIAKKRAEDVKKANADALKAQEADEKAYRDFQNFVGVRFIEDEAARMKQREEEHQATLARMAAAEAAFIGLTITGGGFGGSALPKGPALPTSPFGQTGLGGGGVTVFGEGGPVATGAGVMVHPSISGGLGKGGITVINNNQGAFLSTPADTQRLAERTGNAVRDQLMAQGRQVA